MDEIVIFGAGSGGQKTKKILTDLGYKIKAYADNNQEKWNTSLDDVMIISPQEISLQDQVVISSIYEEEIKQQLESMGLSATIHLKEEYIDTYVDNHFGEIEDIARKYVNIQTDRTFLLESEVGLGSWGVEQYVRTLARIFLQKKETVIIHTNAGSIYDFNSDIEEYIKYFQYFEMDYWTAVKEIVKEIVQHLPCVVFDNWQSRTLVAAVQLKKIFPDKIKIVSMMHNDLVKLQETINHYRSYINVVGAVSSDILSKYQKIYGTLENQELFYKESPILVRDVDKRYYQLDKKQPIRIAYGARIVKAQKRADLLLDVIDLLEKKKINYHLDIAGNGNYLPELEQKIRDRNLGDRVVLKGNVASNQMSEYWMMHDIFISLSEFEGMSLSMLEAMAVGCIPVVTEITGIKEFIQPEVNGYYVNSNDIEGMVDRISELASDREKLPELGMAARDTIVEKCSYESYYNALINKVH